jgi:hypothetical protein
MVVWIMMAAIASGALAVAAAAAVGMSWWVALLGYPLVGALGGFLAGMALFLCRIRAEATGRHARD